MSVRAVTSPFTEHVATASGSTCSGNAVASQATQPTLRQNWILTPVRDGLFVIGTPLLVLAAALATFMLLGAVAATAVIILAHIVFTVAHHLPTFIRIYGDVELFARFKWNFVLAPVVPLLFSIAVLGYINYQSYPVEYFLYLYLMLALWDPWHFLRQHYGFMRIYDRPNAAPQKLAARMDLALSVAWFVFIMLASGAWLADYLEGLYASASVPALLMLPEGAAGLATTLTRNAAVAMTLVYAGYLLWCRQRGYFISAAKLALFAATMGVMYLAYTPNPWILGVAPQWSFKVGFATVGIVHMTQYLAIVWRYNRNLAARPERARAGWFRRLHARGGLWIAGGYVVLCLAYGELVTTERSNRWVMSMLLAVGFTSTLLHYYFDGFIWKIRHQQNRENLLAGDQSGATSWNALRGISARAMLLRQLLYFGAPMSLLTVGAVHAWTATNDNYLQHMYQAQTYSQQGDETAAGREAADAYTAMQRQLPALQRLTELHATSSRQAELAFLVYNQSFYEHLVLPSIAGRPVDDAMRRAHRDAAAAASELLEQAIDRGGSLAHVGREQLSADEASRTLASWRRIAAGS